MTLQIPMHKAACRIVHQLRFFHNSSKKQTLGILGIEPDTITSAVPTALIETALQVRTRLFLDGLDVVPWNLGVASDAAERVAYDVC